MPDRRDFLIGAGLVGVAGVAEALVPRRRVSLLGSHKLDELIPRALPGFAALSDGGVVAPPPKGSLADRLYSQTTQRVYQTPDGDIVMLLIAYGGTQSDQLQLHRPESCYPAVGFRVSDGADTAVTLPGAPPVPVRRLSARLDQRVEQILYWARVGEFLPLSAGEQREVRFRNALRGVVPDGVLVRMSVLTADQARGDAINMQFARTMLTQVSRDTRRVLLGTRYAGGAGV